MSFFKFILNEASFNKKDMPEVISKVSSLVSKRLGEKLFAYNQNALQEYEVDGKTYLCYLFFLKSLKAIRFNTINGNFDSVEIWNKFKLDKPSDYTIRLDGMNIVKVIDSLTDLIKNPTHGTHKLTLGEEILSESDQEDGHSDTAIAARQMGLEWMGFGRYGRDGTVTHTVEHGRLVPFEHKGGDDDDGRFKQVKNPNDFHVMALKTFGGSKNLARLSWADIEKISQMHRVRVPGWVRSTATGKGKNKVFSAIPPVGIGQSASTNMNPAADGPQKQYFVKVSPRDPVTNKFLSVKDDEEGMLMTQKIEAALQAPPLHEIEQEMKDPDTLFGHMTALARLVVKNVSKSLFIFGGAGIGKTYSVMKTLEESGLSEDKDFYVISGKITPASLYQMLYTHRNDNTLLVFDDADSVFDSEDAANILKAALDSKDKRTIQWSTQRTRNVDKFTPEQRLKYEKMIDDRLMPKFSEDDDSNDDENDDFPPDEEDDKKKKKEDKSPIKLPSKFLYNGKIIFISNLSKDRVDPAVLNRANKIDMTLTQAQLLTRIERKLGEIQPNVDMEVKQNVFKTLKALVRTGELDNLSMRNFEQAVKIANSGEIDWVELLPYV